MNGKPAHIWMPLAMLALCIATTSLWWWVAFPPVLDTPPSWLANLQSICLGTLPDGRPAVYGWGLLLTTPAGMFSVLMVGWGRDLGPALRWARSRMAGQAVLGLVAVALLVQSGWVFYRVEGIFSASSTPFTAAMLDASAPMPEGYHRGTRSAPNFDLVDANGHGRTLTHWKGDVVLLTFVFGECTTVCPVLTARLAVALRKESRPDVKGVLITLDPWRDTPGSLAGLHRKWNLPEEVTLLSGTVRKVTEVLDRFETVRRRDLKTGEIDHVPVVYVIDRKGRLAYTLLNPSPDWMAEAARRATLESS